MIHHGYEKIQQNHDIDDRICTYKCGYKEALNPESFPRYS